MSTHCGRYPTCLCPKDIGHQCHLPMDKVKPIDCCEFCGNTAYKTNGKSQLICYNRAFKGNCEGVVTDYSDFSFEQPFKKIGRNEACPCGSGKKFKRCCLNNAN